MSKYISIIVAVLLLSMFAGTGSSNPLPMTSPAIAYGQNQKAVEVMPPIDPGMTKLSIWPQYANVRLQPGESKDTIVTVKNNDNKSINVVPKITAMPYGPYVIGNNFVTITPNNVDIPAGESVKFTVNVTVPQDAILGSSNVQISFANDTVGILDPIPMSMPTYSGAFQLSIEVWKPPNLQISTPFINDQIEAGKEYDYDIKVKNIGNSAVTIDPILVSDMYYGPAGMPLTLTEESIIITAPDSIPSGSIETINVHVIAPADTVGYYNGYIDLTPDDPSVVQGEARINIGLSIWKQPIEPYVKSFIVEKVVPITVEVSSYYNIFPYSNTARGYPSFDTSIVGPDGNADLNITKTVIKGNVNMGIDKPLWDNTKTYQETGNQYLVTYKTNGSPGEWKLNILPNNTQGFDYSITIGE